MHRQLAAERIRRAAIVSADGVRERLRLEAEGDCQSATALATGEAQVRASPVPALFLPRWSHTVPAAARRRRT